MAASTSSVMPLAQTRALESQRQQNAARLSLASNIFLVFIKIAAGLASHSISVFAEGVQSSIDVIASIMILVTLRVAAAPPDRAHPYGHGKVENIASMAQMILILATTAYLLFAAWTRLQHPQMPHLGWGAASLAVAMVVNIFVSRHLIKVSKETGSQALEAEAAHLRSDLLTCGGILAGLAAVALTGKVILDPLMAFMMAGIVAASAGRLLYQTVRPLLDESLPGAEEDAIVEVFRADPRVLDYHRLRTRRAGSYRLIDVHIMLDDHLTFSQAHAITEEVEGAIRHVLPNTDIIVHAEPFEEELRHQTEAHMNP